MTLMYLSQASPRVPLRTEAELRAAVAGGLLSESHFLDLKREIKDGKSENRGIARDLAAFAVDGGTLIIGVAEREGGALECAPQPLVGLPERLDQIAAMIVDPPLAIVCTPIASGDNPSKGYLLVHVPVSPTAPHMVDNRYVGRGDKTNRYLTDGEVVQLHQRRIAQRASGYELLEAEFARDLFDDDHRQQAHMFLMAEPVTPRPDMLAHITDGDGWQQRLLNFREAGRTTALRAVLEPVKAFDFSPGLQELQTFDRRASGAALSTYEIAQGRVRRIDTSSMDRESGAELEVGDNGSLRIFSSRLGATVEKGRIIFDAAAVGLSRQLVALTVAAAESSGYLGNWTLGFGATGLKGTYSYRRAKSWGGISGSPYSEDDYKRVVTATYAELFSKPGDIASALVGPLLRAYGSRDLFASALSADTEA